MAFFSLVASQCMSTKMHRTPCARIDSTSRSAGRKGQSSGFMNTRPSRLITPTRAPELAVTTAWPGPGAVADDGAVVLADRHVQHQLRIEDQCDARCSGRGQRRIVMAFATHEPSPRGVHRDGGNDQQVDVVERYRTTRRLLHSEGP